MEEMVFYRNLPPSPRTSASHYLTVSLEQDVDVRETHIEANPSIRTQAFRL